MQAIEDDEDLAADANIAVLEGDASALKIGQKVRVRVSAPRMGLGFLVKDFDDLLRVPGVRVAEPHAYFVIDGALEKAIESAPEIIEKCRNILSIVAIFADAPAYLDKTKPEFVFLPKNQNTAFP